MASDIEYERLKKRRQRQGYRCRQIEVHDASGIPVLVAEGLLAEWDIDNDKAINEAYAAFVARHCSLGRLLRDKTWKEPEPKKRQTYKPKPKDKPRHGHTIRWRPFPPGLSHPFGPTPDWSDWGKSARKRRG
jgi:hypothetical protein